MTMLDSGYSEAAASLFIWVADKTLGGVKKAFGWSWDQVAWAKAQDRYDAEIIRQHGTIRIFGQTTPKPLREIYTDVFVLDTPTAHRRFGPEQLAVHLWNEERGLPFRHAERKPGIGLLDSGTQFFLLGKPGAGKTTFLKYLAVREARRGAWGRSLGKLPIFVPLRQYADAGKSLFDFIVDQFDVCHFPGNAAPFVDALLASGKALVLFDGLDEVAKSDAEDRRGAVTAELMTFARTYSRCHILITCRIAAIDTTLDDGFTYLEMADFVPEQVDHFVRAWFLDADALDVSARLAQEMLDELARPDHAGIRDLGRSPLLLTLLCLNYAETLTFPARRVEIYEEALDALLKKWDSSRQIRRGGLYKTLSLGRKRQMFARIAYDAFARSEIVFPQASLEAWLKAYLVNVPELPAAVDIDAEAVLQEIVAQHGIFAEQARHLFSFAHLTFQEYYAASYVAESMNAGVLDTLLAHVTDAKWREVFLLTASLLPDATAFLDKMLRAVNGIALQTTRVKALVQVIGGHAGESQAGSTRPAIRLHYFALAFGRALGLARDRDRALALLEEWVKSPS
ncbi:MAG: NACHT domain-containing protein, partial [Caldilinea sp.]|nr:NACHT domain-containing protein [Caldilinea sp.]